MPITLPSAPTASLSFMYWKQHPTINISNLYQSTLSHWLSKNRLPNKSCGVLFSLKKLSNSNTTIRLLQLGALRSIAWLLLSIIFTLCFVLSWYILRKTAPSVTSLKKPSNRKLLFISSIWINCVVISPSEYLLSSSGSKFLPGGAI